MSDSACHTSSITNSIIEMMQYGQPLEKKQSLEDARPLLETVESLFSYYEGKNSEKSSPIISLPRVNDEFEQALADYIIIRFGLFRERYLREINHQLLDKMRNVIPEEGSMGYKEYKRLVPFYNHKGERVAYKSMWDYRIGFNMIAYNLAQTDEGRTYFRETEEVNTLICDKRYFPKKTTSPLYQYVHEGFSKDHCFNLLTGTEDAASVMKHLKAAKIGRNSPLKGNVFILYINSPRYRSFNNMAVLQTFQQLGYDVRNLFVFDISEKGFSLKNLLDERTRLSNIYNGQANPKDDYFCYTPEDTAALLHGVNYSCNREVVACGEDFDVYFPQVSDLLEGFGGRQRVLCNILSLCATKACEKYFYEHLNSLDTEFEADGVIEIFDYIRRQWQDTIIPSINRFVGEASSFSFIVEYSTPETIKSEIQSLFPDKQIIFRCPSDLSPRHEQIDINEDKIIVMRYLQCKFHPSSYPNSYDPYIINEGQELKEIILEILFKGLCQMSLSNQVKHSNGLLDSTFRRNVLHWEPRKRVSSYTQSSFDIFGDDEWIGDDENSSFSAEKVRIVLEDGSISSPVDTEPIIYCLRDGTLAVGTLREIVNNTEIHSIQFLSDMERKLSKLLEDRGKKSISADSGVREELKRLYPDFDFSNGEIWKLALKAKIEKEGLETVVRELSPQLEERRISNRLKDWSNPDSKTMLPRKKRTRKVLFDYIGISTFSAYLRSLYSRYLSTIRNSREVNALIDGLIKAVVGHDLDESYYQLLRRRSPESLDLFGIENLGDLEAIQKIISENIDLKPITSITNDD